jgi:predicted ATPase
MITKVVIENFKRFSRQELDESIVLAGPNNSGKSTLLQALSTWSMALERWRLGKGRIGAKRHGNASTARIRTGQPVTRKDFTALPLREFSLLWHKTLTALRKSELGPKQQLGEPRLIHITVHGSKGFSPGPGWSLTMELRYQSTEQIYVKPVIPAGKQLPPEAEELLIVHCPPFSGIGAEERRLDRGAQQLEVGKGKPGDILRNLLLEVSQNEAHWEFLAKDIKDLFQITLLPPEYNESVPFILCEYLDGISRSGRGKNGLIQYDIASGGSGFHQVLLLLSFFYSRPASVLLLDEPDAHQHVVLQRQIYEKLRSAAARQACQLVLATHSPVILDATAPARVVSFLGNPHRLVHEHERDQVREAMGRLTTLDLLLAEQGRDVLYCEGESDFNILQAWAKVLGHPAKAFFARPFFHRNGGRSPREAKGHLFALRAIRPVICGLLLLDGDNREVPDREVGGDGLKIARWKRYEIENYLLVPEAIRRMFIPTLFEQNAADRAIEYLRTQMPESFFENPLSDQTAAAVEVPASKKLLPQMFLAAGRKLEKGEFYLIAEQMTADEIHPDVIKVLDEIARLVRAAPAPGRDPTAAPDAYDAS